MFGTCLLALLLPGCPTPPTSPPAPPQVYKTRFFSLPALSAPKTNVKALQMGRLFQPPESSLSLPQGLLVQGEKPGFFPPGVDPCITSPGEIEEALHFWTGPRAWTPGGTSFLPLSHAPAFSSRVMVSQTPEILREVESCLEALRRTLRPRFSFRAALFLAPPDGGAPPFQALDPRRGDTLFKEVSEGRYGKLLALSRGNCLAFDSLFLGKTRSLTFLSDLDVEVASKSVIADPKMKSLLLRQGVGVAPFPSPLGDKTELACFLVYQAPLAEPRGVGLQVEEPRMVLEKARIENIQAEFTVGFKDRLALLLAPGSWEEPHLRLLLLAKRLDPYPEFPGGVFAFPKMGAATTTGWGAEVPDLWSSAHLDKGLLPQIFRGLDQGACKVLTQPHILFLKGPQRLVEKARDVAGKILGGFERSFRFQVAREKTPAEPYADEEREWTPLGTPTVVPCLGGRAGFAFLGREETYVADFNAEIAQKAQVAVPVVAGVFDGSQVLVRVDPAGDVCSVKVDILEQRLEGFRRIPSAETKKNGTIQAPRLEWSHWAETFCMRPGETRFLGYGPPRIIRGRLYRTRVSIRLLED